MSAITVCAKCGSPVQPLERFCGQCGGEIGSPAPGPTQASAEATSAQASETPPAVAGGISWSYNIPIVNNRYVWFQWAWATLIIAAVPLVLLAAVFLSGVMSPPDYSSPLRIFVGIVIACGVLVVVIGFIGALLSFNSVTVQFTLTAQGAFASGRSDVPGVEGITILLGSHASDARNYSELVAALLPGSWDVEWRKVWRVDLDEGRDVISLHRHRHLPMRVYATPENWEQVVSFVRDHTTNALGASRAMQAA